MIRRVLKPLFYLKAWIGQVLKRKPNQFIERLEQQAHFLVLGTEALQEYMKKPSKKNAKQVRAYEKEADEVRRILIDELNQTFVTPIDREDLFALSRAIDDVLDYTDSTTKEMFALDITPDDTLRSMADILHKCAQEILLAIQRLEEHPNVANIHVVRIKDAENSMETLYTDSLSAIFKKNISNLNEMMLVLKLREIYRHMYYAIRSAEEAGDIISHVVVKFY